MDNVNSDWNECILTIEKVDGEYEISLSDIIKNSIKWRFSVRHSKNCILSPIYICASGS
ncbi:hypothetical protein [Tissierella praeacuta]|uniref:hypothetical protein n=1 Tax=Tissierella praeacuta TaxID=43131 RepID=UPI00333FE000